MGDFDGNMTDAQAGDFDYIIVGAGAAGSVLAERLSSDPDTRVLLLEEGRGAGGHWASRVPQAQPWLLRDPTRVYGYHVEPGPRGPAERWLRGRMPGGSSAVGAMLWLRGGEADWTHMARVTGSADWDWPEMARVLRLIEHHAFGARALRRAGPLRPLMQAVLRAGAESGWRLRADFNEADPEGLGPATWMIDDKGRRVTAWTAFVRAAKSRPNLRIETGVRVDRVLIDEGRAYGVEGRRGTAQLVFRCRGEVILCTGAVITPKILMLSGVGDGMALRRAGIETKHHSPNIGRGLRDHLVLATNWRLRHWRDSDNRAYTGARLWMTVARYLLSGAGPLGQGGAELVGFIASGKTAERPDLMVTAAAHSLEVAPGIGGLEPEPGMRLTAHVLRPESSGYVFAAGPDPDTPPRIEANYLASERDRLRAILALRKLRGLAQRPALAEFIEGETVISAWARSDDDILDLYRRYSRSAFNAVGSCAMGPDELDPLDARLRLRGVARLRVCDASIFPEMPAGGTLAPVMAAALRAAEFILSDAGRHDEEAPAAEAESQPESDAAEAELDRAQRDDALEAPTEAGAAPPAAKSAAG
ncbi:GMC family oxidoreductase [Salipiger mangrovisoli]|uniref:GMC family oxidoreductase N-terminal domain-containing protein n=1 Tax=Salipiger mangrovisoli TaxID=2865933 RepID=A0ABR9X2J4_9RHOB|nr:GMC family oxidoreductase N-terminal domain-containing protein [Salipiger mangrovisoli]MBE9637795.1 GMC family oxidoreductase N-terminal domain-containing protein [Salipiger mangrovisoli]